MHATFIVTCKQDLCISIVKQNVALYNNIIVKVEKIDDNNYYSMFNATIIQSYYSCLNYIVGSLRRAQRWWNVTTHSTCELLTMYLRGTI